MPRYRVQLVRRVPLVEMPRNPFSAQLDPLKPIPCHATYREWEITARSEKHVRKLFKEAQEQRIANVIGFALHSIETIEGHGVGASMEPKS